jgi:hypothetical protein
MELYKECCFITSRAGALRTMGLIFTCDLHARRIHLLSPEHQQSSGTVLSRLADNCYPLRTVELEGFPAVMNSIPPAQDSDTSNALPCYLSAATCNLTTFSLCHKSAFL